MKKIAQNPKLQTTLSHNILKFDTRDSGEHYITGTTQSHTRTLAAGSF